MRRMPDGRWMASLELSHSHNQYIFLVDGKPVSHDVLICWLAYKEAKSVLNEPAAAKP